MSSQTILFFLLLVIAALVFVILYQRFVFRKGIQAKLGQISRKLEEISGSDSDEKVMVFTDSPALMELAGEINAEESGNESKTGDGSDYSVLHAGKA